MPFQREDITLPERIRLVTTMIDKRGQYGVVSELARDYRLSRQSLYTMLRRGQEVLAHSLVARPPGRLPLARTLLVDKNRLDRAVVTLTVAGHASLEGVQTCLAEVFDVHRSTGYVSTVLDEAGGAAHAFLERVCPPQPIRADLDEIFTGATPHLVVVDHDSTLILALQRTTSRDSTAWGVTLLDQQAKGVVICEAASDSARGIVAGIADAELACIRLGDLFHVVRDLMVVAGRLERVAYGAIDREEQVRLVEAEAQTPHPRRGPKRRSDLSIADAVIASQAAIRRSDDYCWLVGVVRETLEPLDARSGRLHAASWSRPQLGAVASLLREMTDPRGGFYSTLDADSEGVEGKYYIWTPQEVELLLGPDDAAAFDRFYDVTPAGNFEGKSILHVSRDVQAVARELNTAPDRLSQILARGRQKLLAERDKRVRPGLDDKVLTAWNGLMLRALAEAARVLGRDDYRAAAERNAEFVMVDMRRGDKLLRSWKDGQGRLDGYLEDYAAYADGLLALYEATFEPRWLSEARVLADQVMERFWDPAQNAFFDTATDHEQLIVRPRDFFDNATPSGNSLAADVLLRLAKLTGEERYEARARTAIKPLAEVAARHANGFGRLLCALDFAVSTIKEVAIIGRQDDPATRSLIEAAFSPYVPHKVVAGAEPGDHDAIAATPLLADRGLVDGKPAAYVCVGFTCQAPTSDPRQLREELSAKA